MIQHIIHDQTWIVNVILDNKEEGKHFEKESTEISLDDMIKAYDEMVSRAENLLGKLEDDNLSETRKYKEYEMSVEEWFFEYIHHLNQHAGELAIYLSIWKREQRAPKK
jgi:hypothetical protein